jgi:MFS family permease
VQTRNTLFARLAAIVFFGELAHGMLLYGIIPELVGERAYTLFGALQVSGIELAGYCLAAYVLAELAFKLPAGHIVDHHGPDIPLRVGIVASLVTVPIILLCQDPHLRVLGSFLHGLGAAPIWPAVISAWTRGRSARERGEIMGQILTFWMAGLGIGLVLGNVLVGLTGRAELAATYAPVGLWLVTVVASLWGGERMGYPARHGLEEGAELDLSLRFPRELQVMAVGLFLQNLAFGALILPFRDVARTMLLGGSAVLFGLTVAVGGAPAVFLLGPMGKVADRIGRRNAVIYSMLVVAPLIAVAPFLRYVPVGPLGHFAIMVPGVLLAAVAYALLLPAWHALALGRIPEHQRGRLLALLMSVEMVALACGEVVGPAIYTKIDFRAPFVFAGLTFTILAIVYKLGYVLPTEIHDEHAAH